MKIFSPGGSNKAAARLHESLLSELRGMAGPGRNHVYFQFRGGLEAYTITHVVMSRSLKAMVDDTCCWEQGIYNTVSSGC